jgi:pimeloyl-ACP methyl ester carboxylesterase
MKKIKIFYLKYKSVRIVTKILIFLGLIFSLDCCMQFRTSTKGIYKKFGKQPVQVEVYELENKNVRYVHTGNDTLPLVLFIHGAPGSSEEFYDYLKNETLLKKCQMIAVDRVGYGYSDFGKAEISLEKQAFFISPILEKYKNEKIILVGHSYGGPVVARLAMDYPNSIKSIILAAPAIDPDNEKMFWINRPLQWGVFRWMIPRSFKVANDEKMAHSSQLKLMLPKWQEIKIPVTYIHGKSDWIVPFINNEFAKKMLINAKVEFILKEKTGHLFPFTNPEILQDAILKCL